MARLPLLLLLLALPAYASQATDPPQEAATEKLDLDAMARAKDGPRADQAQGSEGAPSDSADENGTEPELVELEAATSGVDEPVDDQAVPAGAEAEGETGTDPIPDPDTEAVDMTSDGSADPDPDPATGDTAATGPDVAGEAEGHKENEPAAVTDAAGESANTTEPDQAADACIRMALELLEATQRGDFATATADFDDAMQAALSPIEFARAWNSLGQFGELDSRGQPHVSRSSGYIAVNIPLMYERAALYMQVACGEDGRIGGFHVQPLETMTLQP